MPAWFLHLWYGYLLVQLRGFSPERFLNLCSSNRIEIWDLEYRDGGYQFYITVKGYRAVKPLVKKSKVRLRIVEKFGLPFFLYRNRKRKLYFTGIASFFLILYLMSLFVWDIQFEGNRMYTYETLTDFLETEDITFGMRKSLIDCDALEEEIRLAFPEITWVSARVSGTRLLVKIKENEVLSSIPQKDTSPCDIVAAKDGVITSMIVRQGTPVAAIGDQVEKGQVLVKGEVEIKNDSEEVVNVHYVHADADIMAKTEYQVTNTFPRMHTVVTETGKVRQGRYLKAFQYSALFILPSNGENPWKMVMEEEQLKLFQNFYLPIYLGKIKAKEYITYECLYTKEEENDKGTRIHQEFVKNLLEKGVQIIENNVKIQDDGSNCAVNSYVLAVEAIGEQQTIQEEQMKTEEIIEPDERN